MNILTINQALDKIFSLYEKKKLTDYQDVLTLKQNLVEIKLTFGGNTPLENPKEVESIIKFGSANPKDWK
jgi:hypothetical protein